MDTGGKMNRLVAVLFRFKFNIDFGKLKIPCLTIEDFIISKIYSTYHDSDRFNDMDDLRLVSKKIKR